MPKPAGEQKEQQETVLQPRESIQHPLSDGSIRQQSGPYPLQRSIRFQGIKAINSLEQGSLLNMCFYEC